MRNFKATIEYNGSLFFGWQKQKGKRTVQGEIESALFSLTKEKVNVEGSGRTDKGVHAFGQVASFKLDSVIPVINLKKALNNLLPNDVRIKKLEIVDEDFHARYACKRKTYLYCMQVGGERSAMISNQIGYFAYNVDLGKMQKASKLLVGKHNFRGFCSSDSNVNNFERMIYSLEIKKKGRKYFFEITGNGFLYNMVRIIVGTLLEVGCGKLDETNITNALESGERKYSGQTVEPNGLYLKNVMYDFC